jgi:hypothetical protein
MFHFFLVVSSDVIGSRECVRRVRHKTNHPEKNGRNESYAEKRKTYQSQIVHSIQIK